MPELPEVETIKRDLICNVIDKEIVDVDFLWSGTLKNVTEKEFKKKVTGAKITSVHRRAKNIDVGLSNNLYLLFHMKMTGHLIYTSADWKTDKSGKWIHHADKESPLYDPLNQYIRVIFWLDDGNILAFSDLRKFGYLKLLTKSELDNSYLSYGAEPLTVDFTKEYLENILSGNRLAIKKILMDQKQIAGIGNIYADEILWTAKVHPLKRGADLSKKEIANLYLTINNVLSEAVRLRGTSTSDFRDLSGQKGGYGDILKVYHRTKLPCYRDKTPIERIVVGGRGTHICPKCQRIK